jgi:hypothetical protein
MFQYEGKPVKKWSADFASARLKPYALDYIVHASGTRIARQTNSAGTKT